MLSSTTMAVIQSVCGHHGELRDVDAEISDHVPQIGDVQVAAGMSIPEELARREKRLEKLVEARAKIEARAKEQYEREQAEHEAKLAARESAN
jgi:hypothetical protein